LALGKVERSQKYRRRSRIKNSSTLGVIGVVGGTGKGKGRGGEGKGSEGEAR